MPRSGCFIPLTGGSRDQGPRADTIDGDVHIGMNRKVFMKNIAACVAALGFICAASAAEPAKVQSEVLLRSTTSWDGVPYTAYPAGTPELTVLKITIPPHTQLPWHTHPMPNAGYVLSGDVTVEKKDNGQKQLITQGQVLPEMVGAAHRGVTGERGAELIVFYAGTPGMPLSNAARH